MRYEQGPTTNQGSFRHIMASKPSLALLLLLVLLLQPLVALFSAGLPAAVRAKDEQEYDDPELLDPDETWHKNRCFAPHDFDTDGHQFKHMLYRLNVCLLTWTQTQAHMHIVLCPQSIKVDGEPCGYVIMPLKGRNGDECTLAFRADNMYLAAFANGEKEWFVFPRYKSMFPTATVLDFGNDYKDFMGEGGAALAPTFQLGKESSLQAVGEIKRYKKAPGSDSQYIRRALGTIILTIPEAKRFTPIRETIFNGWDVGTSINDVEAVYLLNWRELSCALLVSQKTGVWGDDKSSQKLGASGNGIAQTQEQALNIVDTLLMPRKTKNNKCAIYS